MRTQIDIVAAFVMTFVWVAIGLMCVFGAPATHAIETPSSAASWLPQLRTCVIVYCAMKVCHYTWAIVLAEDTGVAMMLHALPLRSPKKVLLDRTEYDDIRD